MAAAGAGGVFMRVVLQTMHKMSTYKKRNDKVSYPKKQDIDSREKEMMMRTPVEDKKCEASTTEENNHRISQLRILLLQISPVCLFQFIHFQN